MTAASGLAIGLPANWGFAASSCCQPTAAAAGGKAILAGSCSAATIAQVRSFIAQRRQCPRLAPLEMATDSAAEIASILKWAEACWEPIRKCRCWFIQAPGRPKFRSRSSGWGLLRRAL